MGVHVDSPPMDKIKVIEVTETKGTVDNPLDGALDAFDLTYVMIL